ncbi:MAG: glycosyltransferase family 4 protein [Opitutaceae bacterium]
MKDGIAGGFSTTQEEVGPFAERWKFALEIFPADWKLPNAPFWVAGWILSERGAGAADVRVWFGGNLFLGLCGLPRPEIERAALGRLGPPHAGFSFLLPPDADASELRFEVCDESGRWQEFHRQSVESAAADGTPQAASKILEEAEISRALLRFLMKRRAHPSISWETHANEAWLEAVTVPLDALPNPPFFGRLEFPQRSANVKFGLLEISGWLAHRTERIVRLLAFIGPNNPVTLLHGRPRGDVSDVFGELRDGQNSQFAGFIEVPRTLPEPLALRILVQLENGEQHLAFNQRFFPQVIVDSPTSLPDFSQLTFEHAVDSLRAASKRLDLPVETSRLRGAAAHALAVYRSEAPTHQPQATRPRIAPLIAPIATPPRSLHVVLVTHNLNREGAPLIALEYAKHLTAHPGWKLQVVSPENGPLASEFLAAGLPAEIVDVSAVWKTNSAEAFEEAIGQLASLPCYQTADVIVANTMVAFWAIHVARRLNKPSILYVHESASVRRFFAAITTPSLLPKIGEAFGMASRVAFAAAASQSAHLPLQRRENFCVVPGWINTAGIAAYVSGHAKAELRRAKNIPSNAVVFVNVGSVCERKGQHVFLRAIEILKARAPSEAQTANHPLVFFMVGASPGPFVDFLRNEAARRQLRDVHFVERVSNPYEYFRMADICVCSSFEESLPRVVMEAAAFGVSVVTTAVNGVPEILGPEEAWLTPAGDAQQLAEAMASALDAHLRGDRTRAERAQRRVRENFDSAILLPEHRQLAIEVAGTTSR